MPASQPLACPGPHRARGLPGTNPAWAPGCLASLGSLKLVLRVQSLFKGCWDAGRHSSLDTFWWCGGTAWELPHTLGPDALLPGCPCLRWTSSSPVSQLPAASDCQFCDSNGALPTKYQGICSYRCREGKCGGYGEMPGHSLHMKYLN